MEVVDEKERILRKKRDVSKGVVGKSGIQGQE